MEDLCTPPLGHITTFGGHPVSAAAGLASLNVIINNQLAEKSVAKGDYFEKLMARHPKVKRTWGLGLFRAAEVDESINMFDFLHKCIDNGILMDLFIFRDHCFRFTPPLIINNQQIEEAVELLGKTLDQCTK
jgi:acetylornithine/succinyldiaminopimelate/putrescine aminotransferase